MKKISIIGSGYVGLTTGVCLAEIGHEILCADNSEEKIGKLNRGICPIFEPGLEALMQKNKKRISFTTDIGRAVKESEIIFFAVGTPSQLDGSPDLSYVENVARDIATYMNEYKLIVEKSTVPVQTAEWIKTTIQRYKKNNNVFDVASNPEFLREGSAIDDFLHPDRIVIGVETEKAKELLLEVYEPIDTVKLVVDTKSAELIKHASNSFLAMKISFINAVSNICEITGADITSVATGMGLDKRIGKQFLNSGIGYGGSCFPKDVDAFIWIADKLGYDFGILKEVKKVNMKQRDIFIKKIEDTLWIVKDKTIGILGLAFKPETDDIREAPSIDIIRKLIEKKAKISCYDPQAHDNVKKIFPQITYAATPYEAAKNADCLLLLTEWEEFKVLDLKKIKNLMNQPIIIDGRNMYDRAQLKELGYIYKNVGVKNE